jgi:cellobiose dehydrogenase (acceptor)
MPNNLLLVTWVNGNNVMADFRYATDYVVPQEYTGNAKLSMISSSVNSTYYELTYYCQHCWAWNQTGQDAGSQIPATTPGAGNVVGWAQATAPPTNPSAQTAAIAQHYADDNFGIAIDSARNSAYTSWTALATGSPTTTTRATTTAKPTSSSTLVTTTSTTVAASCTGTAASTLGSWDYIVVGGGAGGIPLAAKLSANGKKVLLLERGPPSSGRWGGTTRPSWLQGTNLTRFDVPGLCNELYVDSNAVCPDYSVLAGCVLGGGTAVNAGLWWKPPQKDFDAFPQNWKYQDMQGAISRTFSKIPFTETPSSDGQLYYSQGYQVLGGVLAKAGWTSVVAGNQPDAKDKTYGHAENMFIHGERGGPMATYLVDASSRGNFKLVMNTMVNRVVRNQNTMTGVEVQGAYCGTIQLNNGGKVILSAGAFGTPKILFRSGIGPSDQLNIVKQAEGSKLIDSSQWINLPVGQNLQDHTQTDIVWTQPSISSYDYTGAYNNPIAADSNNYLTKRAGPLAQAAPVFPIFAWHAVTGPDGISRQFQWQVRDGASHGVNSANGITMTQYLGRGSTSRGRTTITSSLSMTVSTVPYFTDSNDLAAAKSSMQTMLNLLATNNTITQAYPDNSTTVDSFFASYPVTTGSRSANHW